MTEDLTDREREILTFEKAWWRYAGAKEQAIRDAFGMTATRYYQTLHGVIDKPAAYVAEPVLVKRLRRLRDERAAKRSRLRTA